MWDWHFTESASITQLLVTSYQGLEPRAIITQTIHKPHKVSGPIRATSTNLSALLSAQCRHQWSELLRLWRRRELTTEKRTPGEEINWPEKWNWLLRNLRIHKFRLCCYNFRLGWNQINSSSKFQPQKMSLHLSFYSWRPRLELNLDPILRSITLAIQNKPHVSGAFSSLSESTMCILCG